MPGACAALEVDSDTEVDPGDAGESVVSLEEDLPDGALTKKGQPCGLCPGRND